MKAFWLTVWLACLFSTCCPRSGDATVLGANKSDLAAQYVGPNTADEAQTSAVASHQVRLAMGKKAILDARDAGLKFLRVAVTGYFPVHAGDQSDLAIWQNNPSLFWGLMDRMFDDLDAANLRIVPVLLWNPTQFAAAAGENLRTFVRNPQSQSRRLFQRFVMDFVSRYAKRHTILFYELTNELNLDADIDLTPNCNGQKEGCVWDNFTSPDMNNFAQQMVSIIKSIDPQSKVSSGYAIPRPAAWHLMAHPGGDGRAPDWTADTSQQLHDDLIYIHSPFDIMSVHIYPGKENIRFGRGPNQEPALVGDAESAAVAAKKSVYVGEFGDNAAKPFLATMMQTILNDKVSFASIWTWEFYQDNTHLTRNTPPSMSSVEPGFTDDVIQLLGQAEVRQGQRGISKAGTPRVILTWPLPCTKVSSSVDVYAVASDGAYPVSRVDFSADGKYLGSVLTPPYKVSFLPSSDHSSIVTLQAKATSSSGAQAVSMTQVRVRSDNRQCTPSQWPRQ